ncbi:MAG: glycosyltransferase [Lachnospiraceae bacterium]
MKFSIITVSFRPGRKLIQTVENILDQTFDDYEVIIKDGGSNDGSVEEMMKVPRIKAAVEVGKVMVHVQEDKNVYDGMNQAISLSKGDYLLFLNCGDLFHDVQVLEHVAKWIEKGLSKQSVENKASQIKEDEIRRKDIPTIYYGNTFCSRTGAMVHSAPSITGFTCYRNIPCHQSCFYDRRLFEEKQYDTSLKVRADYDHFLWCFYVKKAAFRYTDIIISDYEGGGISEVKENRRLDQEEHKLVTKRYMSATELLKYKTIMLLTLAPLRRKLAEDSALSDVYHRLKNIIYGK